MLGDQEHVDAKKGEMKPSNKAEAPGDNTIANPTIQTNDHILSEMTAQHLEAMSKAEQAEHSDGEDSDDLGDEDSQLGFQKVGSMFGLLPTEKLTGVYPCYLLRLVTLPGWLYVTNHHVCFYASLPSKENGPRKSGYLSRKFHRASPRWYRYYYELRNHVLSSYESAENKYIPLDAVDLSQVVGIRSSKTKRCCFYITTTHSRLRLLADSEVSQKEWMDDLRRAVFMAKNNGNSVRIVLPMNKMAKINKASAFQFTEYIRISMSADGDAENNTDIDQLTDKKEEYYFSFFPDIDMVYKKIKETYEAQQTMDQHCTMTRANTETSTEGSIDATLFSGPDNVLGNTSSGIPALLIPAMALYSKNKTDEGKENGENALTSPADYRSKRNSWSFRWRSGSQDSSKAPTGAQLVTPTETVSPSSFTSAPGADPAVKNVPALLEPTAESKEEPKKQGRGRSASSVSIRNLARSSLGISLKQQPTSDKPATLPPKDETNFNKPLDIQRSRSGSLGGFIAKHARKSSKAQNEDDHHGSLSAAMDVPKLKSHSKEQPTTSGKLAKTLSIWISDDYLNNTKSDNGSTANLANTEEFDDETRKHIQALMTESIRKHFPMLDDGETAVAAYSASFWRTVPYYGRLYLTKNFICFHSTLLAGRQKVIIPIADVTTIRRLKSRGYYLLHGIGLIAKNMSEEMFFEFSSMELRDKCHEFLSNFICCYQKTSTGEKSEEDQSVPLLQMTPTAEAHVSPPIEFDGFPLLSHRTVDTTSVTAPAKPLHFTCLTIGSRGDVQPYISLCKQLQKEGHTCRIASHDEFRGWVEEHGIEFRSIGGDPGELMKLCIENGFLSPSFIKDGVKFFYTWFETLLETAWEACQGTDVLIESPSAMVGVHMAEKLEIPYFRSMPFPWTRTTRFSHPFAMQNYTSGRLIYNDMTYVMIEQALWAGTSSRINRFRRMKLNLPATSLERLNLWQVPYIYSFSPSVVPPPKDWPDYAHCTGYWFLDNPHTNWKPDPTFLRFLEADDKRPIIYIGFGSIIVPDPEAVSRIIIDAVLQANVRAIICKGWSSRKEGEQHKEDSHDVESTNMLNEYPDVIINLNSVPHDWLFPRIHGVVHHGGAGTTAAGLRAGLPTVIKPFFGDQRFWGQRVEELDVGVCIPKLTVERLTEALKTITQNQTMINKAKQLGYAIRQENGPKKAVECIYRDLNFARRVSQKPNDSSILSLSYWTGSSSQYGNVDVA